MTAGVAWAPVRRHLRAVRRSHGTRSPRVVAGLVYDYLLVTFVGGGVLVTALSTAIGTFATPPGGIAGWLAAAVAVGGTAALGAALLAFGPLVAGPATASWLLGSPVRRRDLLAGRVVAVVVATGALVAGASGLVAAALPGPEPGPVAAVGAAVGALLAAVCVLVQTADPAVERVAGTTLRAAVGVAVVAVLGLVLGARAGVAVPDPGAVVPAAAFAAATVVGVAALVTGVVAVRRLDRAGTPALTRGAPLVAAFWASSVALDADVATAVVEERRLRRRAVVRSRRQHPGRRRALLGAACTAALRNRSAWTWSAGLVVVPHAAALLAPAFTVPAVQLACATVVAVRFSTLLRSVAGSAALRRMLGGGDRELVALSCVVPLVVVAAWTLLVAPTGGSTVSLLLLPASALAVVVRHATRPPRAATATLYETPMGISVPVELVADLARGPALLAVLAGVQILLGG